MNLTSQIRIYSLLTVLLIGFSNCTKTPISKPIAGDDRTKNGCIGTAGYQWSSIKKECIRSFELPLQLSSTDGTQAAGVLFSEDKKQVEVYCAQGTFLLDQQTATHYTSTGGLYLKVFDGVWQFANAKKGGFFYQEITK